MGHDFPCCCMCVDDILVINSFTQTPMNITSLEIKYVCLLFEAFV